MNPETKKICEAVQTMLDASIPTPDDLVLTFISRRVLPLQQRSHKIFQMSGHLDPTRITTQELSRASIRIKVKDISSSRIADDWEWGLPPYSRRDATPIVSSDFSISDSRSVLVIVLMSFLRPILVPDI